MEQYSATNQDKANNTYTSLWEPVSIPEIKQFLGLVLLIGILRKPNIHMYWSKNELYHTGIFCKTMWQDWLTLILELLHFNYNEDPLFDKDDDDLATNPGKVNNTYTNLWEPVSILEMKQFLGLVLLIGILRKSNIHMYWSTSELYHTGIFCKTMWRDSLTLIFELLHFNYNDNPLFDKDDDWDLLHKICPIIELVQGKCQKV